MIRCKQVFFNITLVFSFAVIHLGSFALANESGLTLPSQANSKVEITLRNDLGSINPAEVLQVFVGQQNACCDGKSPIAGGYSVVGSTVTFDPAFDFVEGQHYTALTRYRDSKNKFTPSLKEFIIQPENEVIRPKVSMVYPSGPAIPENTLRFYIHFSTPMKPHMSSKFIKLVDKNGMADKAAFMSFKQELWSEDRKRLTLLMDPGRIKRGVAQNLTLGPALIEGNRYSIIVDAGWLNSNSTQAIKRFEKTFLVSPALRILPSTDLWNITPPRKMTLDPLLVNFDRPFDRALLQNNIKVLDANERIVPGSVSILDHEKTWRFKPNNLWTGEKYQLLINSRLEDVTGNNFRELLDHSSDTLINNTDQKTIFFKLNPST